MIRLSIVVGICFIGLREKGTRQGGHPLRFVLFTREQVAK